MDRLVLGGDGRRTWSHRPQHSSFIHVPQQLQDVVLFSCRPRKGPRGNLGLGHASPSHLAGRWRLQRSTRMQLSAEAPPPAHAVMDQWSSISEQGTDKEKPASTSCCCPDASCMGNQLDPGHRRIASHKRYKRSTIPSGWLSRTCPFYLCHSAAASSRADVLQQYLNSALPRLDPTRYLIAAAHLRRHP